MSVIKEAMTVQSMRSVWIIAAVSVALVNLVSKVMAKVVSTLTNA